MKLVMHIGSHKTGTTSIQDYCYFNTDSLIQQGIYYPTDHFPRYPRQHSELAKLIARKDKEALTDFLHKITHDSQALGVNTIFLSGEDMCALSTAHVRYFHQLAYPRYIDTIHIVLVLRNKRDFLMSSYKHNLLYADEIDEVSFLSTHKFSPCSCINAWRSLDNCSIQILSYDSIKRCLLASFFKQVFFIDVLSQLSSNQSLDFLTLQIINTFLKSYRREEIMRIIHRIHVKFPKQLSFPIETLYAKNINKHYPDSEWHVEDIDSSLLSNGPFTKERPDPVYVCTKMIALFNALLEHFEATGEDAS